MKADPEAPAVALPGAGEAAARGGALRSAGFAVSAALSLVTLPLMVRHLGVAGFGRWLSVISPRYTACSTTLAWLSARLRTDRTGPV